MTHVEKLRAALLQALPHAVLTLANLADHGGPEVKAKALACLARLLGPRPGQQQLKLVRPHNGEQR